IANSLKQHTIGLEEVDDGIWSIHFCRVCWDGSTNGTASFADSRNAHGLWKLPEPWTPRPRPPLLAKRADAFRTATTGPLPGDLKSTCVTHVPGLLCYRCSRLHRGGVNRRVQQRGSS